MGNSVGGFHLLRNGDFSNRTHLGNSVSIELKKRMFEYGDSLENRKSENWKVTYIVEGYTCTLALTRTIGRYESNGRRYEKLEIDIKDEICSQGRRGPTFQYLKGFKETIETAEVGVLNVNTSAYVGRFPVRENPDNLKKTNNAWGGVTETRANVYGYTGENGRLFVREWKKKRSNEKPFMGTMAHYFVNNMASNGPDIGLSVAIKIWASDDGHLNFDVDGPVEHPATALFYMLGEVKTTRTWKPTACPHCAKIRRQPCPMFLQSESEDSDGHHRGSRQNARLVSNRGGVYGAPSGNFIEGNNNTFNF